MSQYKTISVPSEHCLTSVGTNPSKTTKERFNHTGSLTIRTAQVDHLGMARTSPEHGRVDRFGHSLDKNLPSHGPNIDDNADNATELKDSETLDGETLDDETLDCETLETSSEVFVKNTPINQANAISDATPKFYYSLLDNCDDTISNLSDSDKESVLTNLSMSTDDSGQMCFYTQNLDENVFSKSANQQEMCATQDKKVYTVESTHTINEEKSLTFKKDLSCNKEFKSPCFEMKTAASIRIGSQQKKGQNSLGYGPSFTNKGDNSIDVEFRLKSTKPKRSLKDGYHCDMSKQRYNDVFCSVRNCAISNTYDKGTSSLESFIVTDTSDLSVIDIFSLPDEFFNSKKTDSSSSNAAGSSTSRKYPNTTDEDYPMHAAESRNLHLTAENADTVGGCSIDHKKSNLNRTNINDLNQCHEPKTTVPMKGYDLGHSGRRADQSEHNEFDSIIKTESCDTPLPSGVYNDTACINGTEPNHKISVRKSDQCDKLFTKSAWNTENQGGHIDRPTCSVNRTVNCDTPPNCDTGYRDETFDNTENLNAMPCLSDTSFGDRTELSDMSNYCKTKHTDTSATYSAMHNVTSCHSDTRQSDTSFSHRTQHNVTSCHSDTRQSDTSFSHRTQHIVTSCHSDTRKSDTSFSHRTQHNGTSSNSETEDSDAPFISDKEHSESSFTSVTDDDDNLSASGLTDDYNFNFSSSPATIETHKNMYCSEQIADKDSDLTYSTPRLQSGGESNICSSSRGPYEYHKESSVHNCTEHITPSRIDSNFSDFNEFDEFHESYALDLFFREDTPSDLSGEFTKDLLSETNGSEGPNIDNGDKTTLLTCDKEGRQEDHHTWHERSASSSSDDERHDNLQMEKHEPFPATSEAASSRMKHNPLRRTISKLEFALSTDYDKEFFTPPSYDESTIRKIHERLTNEGLYDISKPIEQYDLKTSQIETVSTEVQSLCCVCGSTEADNMKPVCDNFENLVDRLSSKSSHSVYTKNQNHSCPKNPVTLRGDVNTNQEGELSFNSKGNHSENSTVSTLNFNEICRKTKAHIDDEPGIYDVYPSYDTDDDSKDNRGPTSPGYIERKLKTVRRINIIDKIFHLTVAKREDENTHDPVKIFRGNPIC